MSKLKDMTGLTFGNWTVLERAPNDARNQAMWKCRCLCERGTVGFVRGSDLRNGKSRSCGCLHNKQLADIVTKHGKTGTRLYRVWKNMKQRCFNPDNQAYERYGGRGITVCEEWASDYEVFEKWSLRNGYADWLTIDRINVDGDYSPENCRWATDTEQNNNKRSNHYINIGGEVKSMKDWCTEYAAQYTLVRDRIKLGWDPVDALTRPKREIHYKIKSGGDAPNGQSL